MPNRKAIYNFLTTAVVFIVLETAAVALVSFSGPIQGMWFSRGAHWFMGSVWGGTESVKHYFSLAKENERLTEENERLTRQIQKYYTAEEENTFLAAGADTIGRFRYVPAKITKASNNRQHNYLILNKGAKDDIRPMSGVITNQGVVGIVDVVSQNYCYVMSFKNEEIEISARLGKDGPVGILTWDGFNSRGAILDGIPQHIHAQPGDTVYTSGFSDHFPPDIPLGVAGDKTIVNGAYYKIKIHLFESSDSRRFATIVDNIDRDEIKELEGRK